MTSHNNETKISRRTFITSLGSAAAFILLPKAALAQSEHSGNGISCPNASVSIDSNGNILITEGNEITLIQVADSLNTRTVTATNLTTGEVNETVLDKANGILHSPYTGEDIDTSSFNVSSDIKSYPESRLNAPARTYERFEFSWQAIRNFGGVAATVTDIVVLIISVVGKVKVPDKAKDTIETILLGIGNFVPDDPNHGIYVVMVLLEWYEDGKLVKAEYNFDEVGVY